MQFDGALIREQGVTFAIAIVKKHVVNNPTLAAQTIRSLAPAFPGLPLVLMAQDGRGRPTYYGRQDIARFLAGVSLNAIPWQRYSLQ